MTEATQEKENHSLQRAWTFWYAKKNPKQPEQRDYDKMLVKLGSFNTIEGFYNYYSHIVRPSQLPKNSNFFLFAGDVKPKWESYPKGGCWMVKLKKHSAFLDRLWEQLAFAVIGEEFAEPSIVGAELSTRNKEDVLSVWCSTKGSKVRFRIAEKLSTVLHLGPKTLIEYKDNAVAIRDKSTFRNAKAYLVNQEDREAVEAVEAAKAAIEHGNNKNNSEVNHESEETTEENN
eukprot:gb/GECH01000080.1/.p1 GENE.gb/GECH01000080.1/~~gb/GECH01000080.1/.p1  ORF type:complete len:231 (+),score=52.36 gb/GECH01000080.1/:1-693(+)